MTPRLLLSCGEPSGDLYAGALTRALRALVPSIAVSGLGGPALAAAGGDLVGDYRGLAVTGLTEGVAKVPQSFAMLRRLTASARRDRPGVLVVIDFPDFNLPLARRVRALGIPVVFYVSPQIWAWRSGRIRTIKSVASRVLVIFPFEERIYREAGIPVEFVGHPLVDLAAPSAPRAAFLRGLGLVADRPTVAVLPGSRPNEVGQLLPGLIEACRHIRRRVSGTQVVVARAPNLDDSWFLPARLEEGTVIVAGETDAVLASADVALTASGTATVQAALHDTPMVIVYRMSPMSYQIMKRLVKVDTVGMVNLIAGERLAPELIQAGFIPERVADEAVSMLTDSARASRIRAGLSRVRERLGGSGASQRAAAAIVQVAGWGATVSTAQGSV